MGTTGYKNTWKQSSYKRIGNGFFFQFESCNALGDFDGRRLYRKNTENVHYSGLRAYLMWWQNCPTACTTSAYSQNANHDDRLSAGLVRSCVNGADVHIQSSSLFEVCMQKASYCGQTIRCHRTSRTSPCWCEDDFICKSLMKSFVLAGSPVWSNGDDGVGWVYSEQTAQELNLLGISSEFTGELTGESHCSNGL